MKKRECEIKATKKSQQEMFSDVEHGHSAPKANFFTGSRREVLPLFPKDAPRDIFLFQLANALLQELPLGFLLGQRQSFLIRCPGLSDPAEPAAQLCTG